MRAAQWTRSVLLGLGLLADHAAAADAADRYPNKPIRIVVGSTPGATPDVLARLIGAKLGESWKQAVVIENRAPSVIGYNVVAKSTPDGYTLLAASPALAIQAVISTNLPYDTLKDFVGVTEIGFSNVVVVVGPGLGVKSVKELVALAREKPPAGLIFHSDRGVQYASSAHRAAPGRGGAARLHEPLSGDHRAERAATRATHGRLLPARSC